ncbi:phage tail protein [Streptococcus uberis]|uniref:phage tail protein n=1 Tax=Streptococcus uberis TaxID=1349 RepID=UPI0020C082A0|nr:phage tail protein [Streptococcus uberis]
MTTFLDHKDNEYEAQTVIKATNAVNGERSLTGTIYTNEEVLNKIDKGWKIKFQDEFYRVIFAKPIDTGNKIQVDFDAVHQFFYDFDKSSVHSQLQDGSHTFQTYLNFIFDGSGYSYNLEVTVNALNKQSFGYKSRLDLFNDIVKSSGIEFFVSGKVVRILQKTGTDLSTIVRKNFNMNELGIEKKINDFVTYQKGFGAWNNKDDHSKGRLEVEYISPLASEYGIIEAEPLVDERYTNSDSLLAVLKQNVDSSYSISVQIDMEDLTKAGYQYTQPVAGDYIMAINETVGFKEKIRIVSFTSEYDVTGKLISHKVTCNDIGTVKKQSNVVNRLSGQLNSNETKLIEIESTAKEALVSADGKNTNYYGTEMPVDSPKGTLKTGDLLFLTVGDTTKQYYWNGAEWIINPFSNDIDFVKKDINDKISEVNAAIKDGDDALNQKYDAIVAKTISHDILISQAQSTADSAKTDATTALSNIASESQKLTEQINALSKTEGDHYTATNQTLTQLDGTVKGLQTDYTALVNKDNEITQTLTNYKQTIDQNTASITENKQNVDGTLSSLQTQVTQNKNDIATKASQLTVNNLSGRMSSAETTITQNANEISTRLSQTNIESLITSKATVITDNKVKETSDSFSREITRVEGLVGGIFSGNRNLLVNTKSMDNIAYTSANKTSETYMGGYVVSALAPSGSYKDTYMQKMSIVPEGNEFIVSFYAKSSVDGVNIRNYFYSPNRTIKGISSTGALFSKVNGGDGSISFNLTTQWKRYWIKWTIRDASSEAENVPMNIILGRNFDSVNSVSIALPALYAGNTTIDYSEAPEDLKAVTDGLTIKYNTVKDTVDSHTQQIGQQGSSLTTTIQRVDSIQSSVSSIDGRLSTVTQTADGLVTTVQNLSVGGRNYILNSQTTYISSNNGSLYPVSTTVMSENDRKFVRVKRTNTTLNPNVISIYSAIGNGSVKLNQDARLVEKGMVSFKARASHPVTMNTMIYKITKSGTSVAGDIRDINITTDWQTFSFWIPLGADLEYIRANPSSNKTSISSVINDFYLDICEWKLESGNIPTPWSPAPEDTDAKISAVQTTVTQTANSWAVKNLTSNSSILGQINLTDGTVKIDGKYVKITGQTLIDNGIITNAMIKDLTADKIIGGTIDANKISVINLNASNITSGQISGGLIKGGVLTALNGAMSIDLNNGTTEMYNDNPAIRRVTADLPNQFIKFSTGTQPNDNNYRIIGSGTKSNLTAAITSIGTNRLRTENNLDGGFTGINIYAGGAGTGDSVVDRVEISSDILKIAHSANSSDRGWVFENINGLNNQYVFRPNTTYQDTYKAMIGTSLNPVDEMYINEMYIKGQRLGYILKDIANRIGNVGSWAAVIS